jgi:retron-type reverse transcriptase
MIGGENLKNAGLPKVSDDYGDGVSIVSKNEVRQLVFEKTNCAVNYGADMLNQIYESEFDTLHNVYSLLLDRDMYYAVYQKIKSKPGYMTPGIDDINIDGINKQLFEEIIEELRSEHYRPNPTRRVQIPKKNGKTRPLGIPSIKDKLIQYVLKLLLESVFEKKFSKHSHGYRSGYGIKTVAENLRK